MEALARLDPGKFYLENVRSVLRVSTPAAQRICDTAVRQGLFVRCIEVACPNGSVAATAKTEAELPEEVTCWSEENGEYEEAQLATRDLPKNVFYRLNESAAHRQVA